MCVFWYANNRFNLFSPKSRKILPSNFTLEILFLASNYNEKFIYLFFCCSFRSSIVSHQHVVLNFLNIKSLFHQGCYAIYWYKNYLKTNMESQITKNRRSYSIKNTLIILSESLCRYSGYSNSSKAALSLGLTLESCNDIFKFVFGCYW